MTSMLQILGAIAEARSLINTRRHNAGNSYQALHLMEAEGAIDQVRIQLDYAELARKEGR